MPNWQHLILGESPQSETLDLKAVVPSMRRLGWAEGPASFYALTTAFAAPAADAWSAMR